ncbi:hypothetical protein LTR53_017789 [Teratosphaeriaceae sp. CCFEE 6253]|nr:hypothetical protein LTR53_017789 [Teratosphaeriaceae sp. CCFEE 6253]
MSESGWHRGANASASASGRPDQHETGSAYTRSPTPPINRSFQAVNAAAPAGDMRINNLLNDEAPIEAPPAAPSASGKKGPGRGNWRRNRTKPETVPLAVRGSEPAHHVPLLPNTGQLKFIDEAVHGSMAIQPATPGSSAYGAYGTGPTHISPQHSISFQPPVTRDHVPTPSYQAQKRNRGVTQHQSALISHRRQQIDWMLDTRLRRVHARARDARESEGAILRAWKRIRLLPADYDSEEEMIKARKARERSEKDDDWRLLKVKDPTEAIEDAEASRKPRVLLAGMGTTSGDLIDIGEEARSLARTIRRASRRLERWKETNLPGDAMIRRRQMQMHGMRYAPPPPRTLAPAQSYDGPPYSGEMMHRYQPPQPGTTRQRSGTGRRSEPRPPSRRKEMDEDRKVGYDGYEDEGGGELDEEEKEMLGEVDADEEESDSDEEMEEESLAVFAGRAVLAHSLSAARFGRPADPTS